MKRRAAKSWFELTQYMSDWVAQGYIYFVCDSNNLDYWTTAVSIAVHQWQRQSIWKQWKLIQIDRILINLSV